MIFDVQRTEHTAEAHTHTKQGDVLSGGGPGCEGEGQRIGR